MKTIDHYLESIDVSPTIAMRVQEVVAFYQKLLGSFEPEHVFLSESVDGQGQRIYENLHLISGPIWCEAHFFLLKDSFDVCRVEAISKIDFTSEHFKPGVACTPESKLKIDTMFSTGISGIMNASGENCEVLWEIGQKALTPFLLNRS
jgi:hypothetical protein